MLALVHTYICSSVVKFYALSCDDDTQSQLLATRTMTTNLRGRHTNRMECCTRRCSFALRYFVVPFLRYHFTHKKLVWVMVCMQREARLTRHEQGTTSLHKSSCLTFLNRKKENKTKTIFSYSYYATTTTKPIAVPATATDDNEDVFGCFRHNIVSWLLFCGLVVEGCEGLLNKTGYSTDFRFLYEPEIYLINWLSSLGVN